MTTLNIVNLVKKYGDTVVVDNLSLQVCDGEFVTLLGPSGCGKTTTLRAIAGLIEIDGGEIYFDDRLMNDVPPHKRSTAMVFQSYALFPHMSVRDNIAFGLRMHKVPPTEREARVNEAMAMLGLQAMADRKPGNLSGGQQQRVALARAIVTQPDILLFDEPLSNLDAKLRERIRIEIRELQRRLKITSIYVTHDQAEAMVISDRIVIMNKGCIEQIGDPFSIYHHPLSSFTAEFIGQANIVEAAVVSADEDRCVLDSPVGTLVCHSRPSPGAMKLLISWRPEDMVSFREGMRNCIVGKVVRSIFMGNLTDIFVDVNGTMLRVQMPGAARYQPGDEITLGVSEEKIQLLR
jgi:ABC-type sugar transport system ATPase subunit